MSNRQEQPGSGTQEACRRSSQPGSIFSAFCVIVVTVHVCEKQRRIISRASGEQTRHATFSVPFYICSSSPSECTEASSINCCQLCVFLLLRLAAMCALAVENNRGPEMVLSVQHLTSRCASVKCVVCVGCRPLSQYLTSALSLLPVWSGPRGRNFLKGH